MNTLQAVALAGMLLLPSICLAQSSPRRSAAAPTAQELERRRVEMAEKLAELERDREAGEQAQKALGDLEATVNAMMLDRGFECRKAFGDDKFCECLNSELPIALAFIEYVIAVTATDERLKYEQMTPDNKKLIDNARRARDKCVRERQAVKQP